jgi:hypothetical protein
MLRFTLPQETDVDSAVRRVLEAHQRYARLSAAKTFVLHLLVIVSLALWVGAMWPALLPAAVLRDALSIWLALLFFAILAGFEEWLWHRRIARYQRERSSRQTLP